MHIWMRKNSSMRQSRFVVRNKDWGRQSCGGFSGLGGHIFGWVAQNRVLNFLRPKIILIGMIDFHRHYIADQQITLTLKIDIAVNLGRIIF